MHIDRSVRFAILTCEYVREFSACRFCTSLSHFDLVATREDSSVSWTCCGDLRLHYNTVLCRCLSNLDLLTSGSLPEVGETDSTAQCKMPLLLLFFCFDIADHLFSGTADCEGMSSEIKAESA